MEERERYIRLLRLLEDASAELPSLDAGDEYRHTLDRLSQDELLRQIEVGFDFFPGPTLAALIEGGCSSREIYEILKLGEKYGDE